MKKFSGNKASFGKIISIKPTMKGGHRHNHIYNVCNRILCRSKNRRKICIENKREWRETFELQAFGRMNPFCGVQFLDIMKKGKYFKQIALEDK
jgi:hypothetical protein